MFTTDGETPLRVSVPCLPPPPRWGGGGGPPPRARDDVTRARRARPQNAGALAVRVLRWGMRSLEGCCGPHDPEALVLQKCHLIGGHIISVTHSII